MKNEKQRFQETYLKAVRARMLWTRQHFKEESLKAQFDIQYAQIDSDIGRATLKMLTESQNETDNRN